MRLFYVLSNMKQDNFSAGSLLVCTDCHVNVHVHCLSALPRGGKFLLMIVSKVERKHQMMLSFLATAEKSRRQAGNYSFRILELTNIMCCCSCESGDKLRLKCPGLCN